MIQKSHDKSSETICEKLSPQYKVQKRVNICNGLKITAVRVGWGNQRSPHPVAGSHRPNTVAGVIPACRELSV